MQTDNILTLMHLSLMTNVDGDNCDRLAQTWQWPGNMIGTSELSQIISAVTYWMIQFNLVGAPMNSLVGLSASADINAAVTHFNTHMLPVIAAYDLPRV